MEETNKDTYKYSNCVIYVHKSRNDKQDSKKKLGSYSVTKCRNSVCGHNYNDFLSSGKNIKTLLMVKISFQLVIP